MKQLVRSLVFFSLVVCSTGLQPLWASPISIAIQNGTGGGYGYSGIHAASSCGSSGLCMGGAKLYWPFEGTLHGDFDATGGYSLVNLTGTLNAPEGTMHITGGQLSDPGIGGNASGFLNYTLSGDINESGTFYFVGQGLCCSGAPNGGPNNLTDSGFTLWGNNWDIFAPEGSGILNSRQAVIDAGLTPLGMDVVGGDFTSTPEPSTMILLGSGLLVLPLLRGRNA